MAAALAEGTTILENAAGEPHVQDLCRLVNAMGGHSQFVGQELVSPDIRAGMALVIAALCAEGTSTIHNIQQIDRGNERIDQRIAELGARIERKGG